MYGVLLPTLRHSHAPHHIKPGKARLALLLLVQNPFFR